MSGSTVEDAALHLHKKSQLEYIKTIPSKSFVVSKIPWAFFLTVSLLLEPVVLLGPSKVRYITFAHNTARIF